MTNSKTRSWPQFSDDQRRSTLVILAGPSGCGKSTFVRALYDGQLPESIRSHLPSPIASAPSVDIKYPSKVLITSMFGHRYSSSEYGCILHYNLNRLAKLAINRIEDDLALLKFWNSTDNSVIIINIEVSGKKLAKQYAKRMFHSNIEDRYNMGPKQLLLSAARVFDFWKVAQLLRYRFGGHVEKMYHEWKCIVSEMSNKKQRPPSLNIHVIGVESKTPTHDEPESFRLRYYYEL